MSAKKFIATPELDRILSNSKRGRIPSKHNSNMEV
jgi:hypothetical protein